ncbi:MAG: helix-turn-helix domain-containing protein [Nitrospira sp.]|jgi:predicted site-specific integrase-resolvase|nr:helix-turn-helix domain-containing protein [Nitrospira sp.]
MTHELLTPNELAARLRVHRQTIRNWTLAGKLVPALSVGHVTRYDWAQVLQDLEKAASSPHPAFEKVQP